MVSRKDLKSNSIKNLLTIMNNLKFTNMGIFCTSYHLLLLFAIMTDKNINVIECQ